MNDNGTTQNQLVAFLDWIHCEECSREQAKDFLDGVSPATRFSSILRFLRSGPPTASLARYEAALKEIYSDRESRSHRSEAETERIELDTWGSFRDRQLSAYKAKYKIKACWAVEAYAGALSSGAGSPYLDKVRSALKESLASATHPGVRRAIQQASAKLDGKLQVKD
jgi:hypothetical protein